MNKRINATNIAKTALTYTAVSTVTIEAWLLFARGVGVDIPGAWHWLTPLATTGLVGIPASIALYERLIDTIYKKPGAIETSAIVAGDSAGREIPFTRNGRRSSIFAKSVNWSVGNQDQPPPRETIAVWSVPTGDIKITVRENEVTRFLEVASRRRKYQFSRRYWTEKRRPPMPRPYYDAIMLLLHSAGLVEGRQTGASGWLVGNIKPHNAITYLKHESPYSL